jgi:hypothetical protein
MVISTMYDCYQSQNPLARTSPLRSIPLYQAPGRIAPMADRAKAEWALAIAARDLPIFEQRYAIAWQSGVFFQVADPETGVATVNQA